MRRKKRMDGGGDLAVGGKFNSVAMRGKEISFFRFKYRTYVSIKYEIRANTVTFLANLDFCDHFYETKLKSVGSRSLNTFFVLKPRATTPTNNNIDVTIIITMVLVVLFVDDKGQ